MNACNPAPGAYTSEGYMASTHMTSSSTDFRAPWEVYPEIPCGSINWRMGPGEDAMVEWWRSVRVLTSEERLNWRQRHTPPTEWVWWLDWAMRRVEEDGK